MIAAVLAASRMMPEALQKLGRNHHPSILVIAVSNVLDLMADFKLGPAGEVELSSIEGVADGKSVHVAEGLSRFGAAEVEVFGFIGSGNVGENFKMLLADYGITIKGFIRTQADTRITLFLYEGSGRFEIRLRSLGEEILPPEIAQFFAQLDTFLENRAPGQFLAVGGSVPLGCDYTIFTRIISEAKKRGLKVVFDFSAALTQRQMLEILEMSPYLIKPDLEEFAELTGRQKDELRGNIGLIVQGAKGLAKEYGVEIVVVSMDKDGAVLVKGDLALWAVPPEVTVLHTMGAGDAFIVGLVHMLNQGAALEEALRFGVACGTATCLEPGTKMADLGRIDRLFDDVKLRELPPGSGNIPALWLFMASPGLSIADFTGPAFILAVVGVMAFVLLMLGARLRRVSISKKRIARVKELSLEGVKYFYQTRVVGQSKIEHVFIAMGSDGVIGALGVVVEKPSPLFGGKWVAHDYGAAVREEYRRQGIATNLMEYALRIVGAQEEGRGINSITFTADKAEPGEEFLNSFGKPVNNRNSEKLVYRFGISRGMREEGRLIVRNSTLTKQKEINVRYKVAEKSVEILLSEKSTDALALPGGLMFTRNKSIIAKVAHAVSFIKSRVLGALAPVILRGNAWLRRLIMDIYAKIAIPALILLGLGLFLRKKPAFRETFNPGLIILTVILFGLSAAAAKEPGMAAYVFVPLMGVISGGSLGGQGPGRRSQGYKFLHHDETVRGIARRAFDLITRDFYELIFSHIGTQDEVRILDLGFGYGSHIRSFSPEKRQRIVGFEVVPEHVRVAKERYPLQQIELGDWYQMPFSSGHFNAISGVNALYFAENGDDLEDLIREIDRVLKPGPDGVKRIYQLFDQAPPLFWFTSLELKAIDTTGSSEGIYFAWYRFFKALEDALNKFGYTLEVSYIVKETDDERSIGQDAFLDKNIFFYDVNGALSFECSPALSEGIVREEIGVYLISACKNNSATSQVKLPQNDDATFSLSAIAMMGMVGIPADLLPLLLIPLAIFFTLPSLRKALDALRFGLKTKASLCLMLASLIVMFLAVSPLALIIFGIVSMFDLMNVFGINIAWGLFIFIGNMIALGLFFISIMLRDSSIAGVRGQERAPKSPIAAASVLLIKEEAIRRLQEEKEKGVKTVFIILGIAVAIDEAIEGVKSGKFAGFLFGGDEIKLIALARGGSGAAREPPGFGDGITINRK